jgi:hypothetical protein
MSKNITGSRHILFTNLTINDWNCVLNETNSSFMTVKRQVLTVIE